MKINIGAGEERPDGFLNVDIVSGDGVDIVADLNVSPWPFDTGSVEHVRARHVFEHLADKTTTLNEVWRILELGGIVEFEVSTTDGWGAFSDPQHVSYWNEDILNYVSSSRNPLVYVYGKRSGLDCNFDVEEFRFFELRHNVFAMHVRLRKVAL